MSAKGRAKLSLFFVAILAAISFFVYNSEPAYADACDAYDYFGIPCPFRTCGYQGFPTCTALQQSRGYSWAGFGSCSGQQSGQCSNGPCEDLGQCCNDPNDPGPTYIYGCGSCPDGRTWDGSNCVCPDGRTWDGSNCVCPDGRTWDGSNCVCPAGTTLVGGNCVDINPCATPPSNYCNGNIRVSYNPGGACTASGASYTCAYSSSSATCAFGCSSGQCNNDPGGGGGVSPSQCGNGVVEGTEYCDSGSRNGECPCSTSCTWLACTGCGNGAINDGEGCDGSDFGGKTCRTYGFDGGSLSCSGCRVSTANCNSNTPSCPEFYIFPSSATIYVGDVFDFKFWVDPDIEGPEPCGVHSSGVPSISNTNVAEPVPDTFITYRGKSQGTATVQIWYGTAYGATLNVLPDTASPIGSVDYPNGHTLKGSVTVNGWALNDHSSVQSVTIQLRGPMNRDYTAGRRHIHCPRIRLRHNRQLRLSRRYAHRYGQSVLRRDMQQPAFEVGL